jgi:hypothetical protein
VKRRRRASGAGGSAGSSADPEQAHSVGTVGRISYPVIHAKLQNPGPEVPRPADRRSVRDQASGDLAAKRLCLLTELSASPAPVIPLAPPTEPHRRPQSGPGGGGCPGVDPCAMRQWKILLERRGWQLAYLASLIWVIGTLYLTYNRTPLMPMICCAAWCIMLFFKTFGCLRASVYLPVHRSVVLGASRASILDTVGPETRYQA